MPSVTSSSLTLSAHDGFPLAATLFQPEITSPRLVLICPGTGIPRGYYSKFARFLAENNFTVLTFDYRGIGESRPQSLRGFDARMSDWAQQDLAGVAHWCAREFQPERFFLICHSAGGQLMGMARINPLVHALVFVAAQHGYWGNWPLRSRYNVAVLWRLIPVVTRVFGYLPARLGIGEDLPRGVANEWAKWGRDRDYLFGFGHEFDLESYRSLAVPMLAYSFWDDWYAPRVAVEALLQKYSAAQITHHHLTPTESPVQRIGHFGFFREQFRDSLWEETVAWLRTF